MEENKNNQTSENSPTQQENTNTSSISIESQPQISPNIPDTSFVPRKKVSKKLILIGLGFLIIVLIISGLYFYLQKQGSSPKTQESSQNKQDTLSPTPGPTANWKTYRNEKYGFEFQYPKEWKILNTDYGADILEPNSSYAFTIHALGNIPNSEKFMQNQRNNPNFTTVVVNPIQVGGFITLHQTIDNKYASYVQHQLWIENNHKIYEFDFLSDSQIRTETINQILSTLKFIESDKSKLKMCPDGWYNVHSCMTENCSIGEHFLIEVNGILEQKDPSDYDLEWIRNNCEINSPEDVG